LRPISLTSVHKSDTESKDIKSINTSFDAKSLRDVQLEFLVDTGPNLKG